MTIPTLMSILSAPGSPAAATSAVAGAELPGTGQLGFACLVQMLLDQGHAPATAVAGEAVPDGDAGGDAGDEPTPPAVGPAGGSPTGSTDVATGLPGAASDTPVDERAGIPAVGVPGPPTAAGAEQKVPGVTPARRGRADEADGPSTDSQQQAPQTPVSAPAVGAPTPQVEIRSADAASGETNAAVSGTSVPAAGTGGQDSGSAAHSAADATGSVGGTSGTNGTATAAAARDGGATEGSAPSAAAATPARPDAEPSKPQSQPQSQPQIQPQPVTVGVTAPASAVTHFANGPANTAAPVSGQVFPEVVRLVTRGDGTQRLTLRLTPENLGEVRIVVTVRDGGVDVRLAAGAEAQDALRHGSADLRRLLESVGATSTQIVVRDLPSGSTSALGTSTGQTSAAHPAGAGAAATYADSQGGHARDHQRGGDASGHPLGQHQTSGPAHTGMRPQPATTTAPAAAAGVDLRL